VGIIDLGFSNFLLTPSGYQKERRRLREFDGFFKTARDISDTSEHPDRDSVLADMCFCLGSIAMGSSDFDASRIYKGRSFDAVSRICKELAAEDDRPSLAYAERGISRIQDRRYVRGDADLKKVLLISKSSGNYIPRSGEANLSWALLAQGKLDECNTLLLESLAGRGKAPGKNDRGSARTGLVLYVLGNLRAAQNQWDESFEYHKRAWTHMRATVSERDFSAANAAYRMSAHLMRLIRNEEAM